MARVVGVIPARFASTRLPGKPLELIGDKPMLWHVYSRTKLAKSLSDVIIATDDDRIFEAAQSFGAQVQMTDSRHQTGSDRIAEVAERVDADILVNIQGDEPFIDPHAIDAAVENLIKKDEAVVGTLITRFCKNDALISPNTAKVVTDVNGFAIYFSRSVIPFNRDVGAIEKWLAAGRYFQHIGLYAFRKEFLMKFVQLPQSELEKIEKLEQLRILENGFKIICTEVKEAGFCVDTLEDLQEARQIWKDQNVAN